MRTAIWSVLLLFGALSAWGRGFGVEVRTASAKLFEVEPGKAVTASFVVENHSNQEDAFNEDLTLPSGWRKITPVDLPFTIPGQGQQVRIIAFSVPADNPAGRYEIGYAVKGRRDPNLADRETIEVVVRTVSGLDLTVEEKPELVIAGDEFSAKLRLYNRGNERVVVAAIPKGMPEFPARLDVLSINLAPRESRDINLRVKTSADLKRTTPCAVTVECAAGTTKVSQTVLVDVIPQFTGDRDPYVRIPATFRFMATDQNGAPGSAQVELSGGGPLDEAKTRRVEFLFRGPDSPNESIYGLRDEYRLSYFTPLWDLHLGDRVYSLSPLTERYGYGRGAALDWHNGPWKAGAFYMQSRYRTTRFKELGSYLSRDLGHGLSMKLNYLRKWDAPEQSASHAFPQNIWSVETRWHPSKMLDAGVEYGIARPDGGSGIEHAWRVDARGQLPRDIHYSIERTRAAPDFYGTYHDSDSTYANLTVPIVSKLRANVSLNDYSGSLERRPERATVVTKEQSWRGGLTYTLPTKTTLSLEYQDVQRRDLLKPADFDFHEQSMKFGIGHDFKRFSAQTYFEQGTLTNELHPDETGSFQRYSAILSWRPTDRQDYSAYVEYGPNSFTGERDRRLAYGVSANWRFNDRISASVQASRNRFDSLMGSTQDTVQASLTYTMENKSSFSLSGRWSRNDRIHENESAILASYSVPLSIPVGKKTSIGSIKGTVWANEGGVRRPLSRVVLVAGEATAVTNEQGEYLFPSLAPGSYRVRVDSHSVGNDRVTESPLPSSVEVRRGKSTRLDVSVVRSGSVTASIMLVTEREARNLEEVLASETTTASRKGFEGAILELSNGVETFREQTDRRGVATFSQLRPGRWSARLLVDNLPSRHRVSRDEWNLNVAAGKTEQIDAEIVATRPKIQILEKGSLR